MRWTLAALLVAFAPAAAQAPSAPKVPTADQLAASAPHCGGDDIAPKHPVILAGYGKGGFPIRTNDPKAQAFFDNGMQLAHAFAHTAAVGAFQEASRLDPNCAMCIWGEAWAAGPTINYPIDQKEVARLAGMAAKAEALAGDAPEKERQLIAALKQRYQNGGGKGPGDRAFAKAMDSLAWQYPLDNEIATMAADAWMIPSAQTNSTANMDKAMALLEPVLRRDPDYTPAIHFYIHATEMAGVPGRAEPYADRLTADAPAASHLVHMPSHTWYHVGRYQDAADANVRAVEIGKENAKRLGLPEVWDLPYHAHNVKYGVGGALISGDGKVALALSEGLLTRAATIKGMDDPSAQMTAGTAYFAEGRFADPQAVFALPEPRLPYAKAYWHYARGEAAARLGDAGLVRAEAALIPEKLGRESEGDSTAAAGQMMRISRYVLEGRAAMLEGKPEQALIAFRKAAAIQETPRFLSYSDPPAFWYPVRRDTAAALLAMGKPADAVREAGATLKMMPKEPATLAIRSQAEAKLGQAQAAAADRRAALAGWHGNRALLPLDSRLQTAAR